MSNDRDRIAGMIDDLLVTQYIRTSTGIAVIALSGQFEDEAKQVESRQHEMIRSVSDQRQTLLDAVTEDAGHAARWRELVEQLNLDLDDTEVPDVFDAFGQDSQKDDGADEEHAESTSTLTVADLVAAPVGSVLGRSSAGGLVGWTKTSDNEWTWTGTGADRPITVRSQGFFRSDGTALYYYTLTAPAPQSPPDPKEHPLIRVHAFRGEELDEPIDAAWFGSLFHSIHKKVFPDGSEYLYPHEVTRWSPLEVRGVSGDE